MYELINIIRKKVQKLKLPKNTLYVYIFTMQEYYIKARGTRII